MNNCLPSAPGLTWHWYRASSSSMIGEMSREKSPSSSLPTIEYLSKPLRFLWTPRPKSSFVHWIKPDLSMTRHGSVTREPMIAVWSCGSMANLCACFSWLLLPLLWYLPSTIGKLLLPTVIVKVTSNIRNSRNSDCISKLLLCLLILLNWNIVMLFETIVA